MKKYQVTVNGVSYEVEVEEVESFKKEEAKAPVFAAPAPVKAAAPAAKKVEGVQVKAPMPGTILKINFKTGDSVKSGDVLCVLEAMKMENDICAPSDGVIRSIEVSQGSSVATDTVLAVIG